MIIFLSYQWEQYKNKMQECCGKFKLWQFVLRCDIHMAMLTILMECHDNETELAQTLAVLVSGAVEGVVSDVIVLDHGSRDGSIRVADAAGCRFLSSWDMRDVIRSARGEWLLLLEPGARPAAGWIDETAEYRAEHRTGALRAVARVQAALSETHRPAPGGSGAGVPRQQAPGSSAGAARNEPDGHGNGACRQETQDRAGARLGLQAEPLTPEAFRQK